MHHLENKKVVMLLGPRYEDDEAGKPLEFLRDAGAIVDVVGLRKGALPGLHGRTTIDVDMTLDEADVSHYDAMVIPGGRAPAELRKHPEAVRLVKDFFETGRPLAAICHGPQMLAAAGLVKDTRITGYYKIRDEMLEAGADFVDEPVVVTGNLITSRKPADIPEFDRALEKALT